MRTRQKFLSLVMSIMMMMSILSSTALAEEPEDEIGEEPVICAGSEADESCPAETHVEGCPRYVAPEEETEDSVEDGPDDMTNDVNEPTIEEQLAELAAALPAPDEIDPEDEEQVEGVNGQISEIYAFAGENGLDIADNEIIKAVITALYPVEPLDDTVPAMSGTCGAEGNGENVTWKLEQNNSDSNNPTTYTLTISGSGAMCGWEDKDRGNRPWNDLTNSITQVIVEAGVTTIGQNAFYGLSQLGNVQLNEELTTIARNAFRMCTSLKSFSIPNSVTSMGYNVLAECSQIETLKIGTGLTKLGEGCFLDCGQGQSATPNIHLKSVIIPANITEISGGSFRNCTDAILTVLGPDVSATGNPCGISGVAVVNATACTSFKISNQAPGSALVYVQTRNVVSYTPPQYNNNLKFAVTNGGTFAADTEFESGTLATPIKDGFIFGGWYDNENCTGTAVTTAPTAGQTYYAKWIKLESNAISMEYGSTQTFPNIEGVDLSNWQSRNSSIVSVEDGQLKAKKVGTTTLTAEASTAAGGTGTLIADVEVTPMRITYGKADTRPDDSGIGRPYIVYALKEGGTAPTLSELLKFYPVIGRQDGTFEADTSKQEITLTPGMGPDGDVYYKYQNKGGGASGNIIETGTLPTHLTTDAEGKPHSIPVELKLKNPNYAFCTVGTEWRPADTVILHVTCHEEDMVEVDMYLEGDTAPLETFDDRHEYEYTGEGIVPTERDLTSLYTKGTNTENSITTFTAHFHAVKEGTAFSGEHLYNQKNYQLTADELKKIAPKELGVYSFVINGYNKDTRTYCYASRRYSIVEGTPQVEFGSVSAGAALSSVPVTVKNAAGLEVTGTITWNGDNQTVERDKSYAWTFTPTDDDHYKTVKGETVLLRASSGGGSGSGGSGSSTVSVDSTRNGSVTVSPKSASKGTTVTVTVKPDKGYEVDEIIVTDKNGNEVKVTRKSDTKYTFTMPAGKVTVEATFVKVEETLEHSFTDVPDGYWAEDAIAWAYENGCMNGTTTETFNPEGTVSRQQLWMILARLSGYNPAAMAEAKSWAVDNGISDGTAPGGPVSRQQLVTILYRYAVRMGYQTDRTADLTAYPDHASVAAYAKDAMSWSVANGIVGGTTQGTLNPAGTATRAQFAVILSRFCENIAG